MPARLIPLREADVPLAIQCIIEAQEWAPHSCPFLSPQDVLGAPNSYWLTALVGEEVLGILGFTGINWVDRSAGLALGVAPLCRGRGISKVLAVAQNKFAFDTLGLRKLKMQTLSGSPSCRIAQAAGLKLEGVLARERLKDGQFHDVSLFAIVKED